MSQYDTICRAIPPQSLTTLEAVGDNARKELEFRTMNCESNGADSKDSARDTPISTRRYGKIGISAVAAAVRHQGEQRNATETHFEPYDRD